MSIKERLNLEQKPIFLIDGSAFVYRGFYTNASMQRSDGFPTNALYVVSRIIMRIIKDERPEHIIFFLDGKGKHFRHEKFPLYKANREQTPELLVKQFDPIKRMIELLGLKLEISHNCEADDCIASLAHRFSKDYPVVIVGADKDLRQCLGHNVYMYDPGSKDNKIHTAESFNEDTGLFPEQWPDTQALMGDTSDNIPGVPGIGIKSAEKIFKEFKNLEDIRDNFQNLPIKFQQKIKPHLEAIFLYRELTTLSKDFCTDLSLDDLKPQALNINKVKMFWAEFELHALNREFDKMLKSKIFSVLDVNPQDEKDLTFMQNSGQQFGLFDTNVNDYEIAVVRNINELPDCADIPIALIPKIDRTLFGIMGIIVGLGDVEFNYTGDFNELAKYSANAGQIIVSDLKALFKIESDFLEIDNEKFFDLGLAAYVINPEEGDFSWPSLSVRWADKLNLSLGKPAILALIMGVSLAQVLAEQLLDELYYDLELPLVPVLFSMEKKGVTVDIHSLNIFLDEVQMQLDELTTKIYELGGGKFNIRSAQQLGDILYNKLQLPIAKKTQKGQLSTSQNVLEQIAEVHPIVDAILEYRKLEKMRSTYLKPFIELVDSEKRIHSTFNQTATATGRLSSSNPNIQNIPIRGKLGKRMRACFIASKNHLIISADYSQIELRVLAHVSKEPALLNAFANGEDIHTKTAALIFNITQENVTPEQRSNAKTINFGLIYGMGAQRLAQELKITLSAAKEFISNYFSHLAKLKDFYDSIEKSAKLKGYVVTLAGRRRIISQLYSADAQHQALGRRQAINTVIQGSAADIIKLAMLEVQHDEKLKQLNAQMILQVHDELLLEVPEENVQNAGQRLAEIMSNVKLVNVSMDVPLVVDWGFGSNWGDAH